MTGLPTFFDSTAASATKSGFDLRPKPPPSSVTWQITLLLSMPSALATVSWAACGFCAGAQAVTAPSRKSATATGGSIVACAWCGT